MRKNIFICIIFAVSISACTEELDKEINIEIIVVFMICQKVRHLQLPKHFTNL